VVVVVFVSRVLCFVLCKHLPLSSWPMKMRQSLRAKQLTRVVRACVYVSAFSNYASAKLAR